MLGEPSRVGVAQCRVPHEHRLLTGARPGGGHLLARLLLLRSLCGSTQCPAGLASGPLLMPCPLPFLPPLSLTCELLPTLQDQL